MLLYSAGINNSAKGKNVSGMDVFSQVIPKGADIKMPNEITGTSTFGTEDGKMVKIIDSGLGRDATVDSINKAFTVGAVYLSRKGYTLALEDLNVSEKVKQMTQEIINEAEKKTTELSNQFIDGSLTPLPGKTMEETRETKILQVLNEVRTEVAKVVKANFPAEGNVNKMITPGAAGSMLNITQIGCVVGQQALGSKRISFGYNDRTLSFFKRNDLGPEAHGFIKSSYFKGLKPTEFFFGAITGRDSLMDTALRTPKSGYLYRRLVSALQDLKVEYDGTVRDASENIVQFVYGDDAKDPSKLHLKDSNIVSGEAAGVVTAQSFGEASTQMVLRVFHHAGVSQMQITEGLPRLIEILDARKLPSTPMMEIYVAKDYNNEKDSKVVAEKLREVKLMEITSEIKIDFANKKIEILLDNKALKSVHAGASTIADRLKDKGFNVRASDIKISVSVQDMDFKAIYKIKEKLKETVVSGIKGIEQVLVTHRDGNYIILASGSNLKEVREIKGVDPNKISSNDIHDVSNVLGIEAARQTITNEIKKVIESQGLDINERHIKLIADAMTSSGAVKGVTRMGIISDKASILARATFETPDKQFVTATIQGGRDELKSVIENILLNQPIPVGTGLPGLLVKVTGQLVRKKEK
jgi:DNA-directed RNA polymerase subunit A"